MSIKHSDIIINPENPFANCKLGREKYANILTKIVKTYADGFVMSINNKWGTGKTTFVKMWERKLVIEGFKTVYFNAWENDFEDNALTALMGELNTLVDDDTEDDFKEVLKKGAVIAKNILPGLAKAMVARYFDMDELKDLSENALKGITEIFEEDVKEYANRKKSISQFREKLEKFITDTTDGRPLIFIIDELDRCRPNYSVAVLEQIKHFFSVPGIVFVLSIDKEQLGNAVKGVYNSDYLDSEEYLRRFIDIEYVLAEPKSEDYLKYLYDYYGFSSFFSSHSRLQHPELGDDDYIFLDISKILFNANNVSLRQQQKIFSHARMVLNTFANNHYVYPILFLFLVYLRTLHHNLYIQLKEKQIKLEQLQEEFVKIVNYYGINEDDKNSIRALEGYIIYFFHDYLSFDYPPQPLQIMDSDGNYQLLVKSKLEEHSGTLKRIVKSFMQSRNRTINPDYLFNRIELLEVIKIE